MKHLKRTAMIVSTCLFLTVPALTAVAAEKTPGVIYAKPENLRNNIPLSKVMEVSAFFNIPENKVKIQFPSEQSAYAWVNQSKFYPTAQVMRQGQVSMLPYDIDLSIGEVAYKNIMQ